MEVGSTLYPPFTEIEEKAKALAVGVLKLLLRDPFLFVVVVPKIPSTFFSQLAIPLIQSAIKCFLL